MSRVLPILFNTDMVRAILDGSKTVTRRIVKPQPDWFDCGIHGDRNTPMKAVKPASADWEIKPPYWSGDILYVRETWQVFQTYPAAYGFDVMYRADQEIRPCIFTPERYEKFIKYEDSKNHPRWVSSQFMPKEAARIWLKVTDVRVERLQKITPEQSVKEGVGNLFCEEIAYTEKDYGNPVDNEYGIAKEQFAWLWDSTIKKPGLDRYGWKANPWVWVIEFERCEKPEETV